MGEWSLYWLKIKVAWWYLIYAFGRDLSDRALRHHRVLDDKLFPYGWSSARVIKEIGDQINE